MSVCVHSSAFVICNVTVCVGVVGMHVLYISYLWTRDFCSRGEANYTLHLNPQSMGNIPL